MANPMDAPDHIRIAALERKKGLAMLDLMRPGPGTPWEGRGGRFIPAFFQTCLMSIFQPARLLDSIRRPESREEGNLFAILCGCFWSVSLIVHMGILYYGVYSDTVNYKVDQTSYWETVLVIAAILPFAIWASSIFLASIWHQILSMDMASKAPPVLARTLFAYMLGPSILALIPIAGPPLALLGIFIDWNVAGITRMYAKTHATIIATVLVFAITIVMAVGIYFVGAIARSNALGDSVTTIVHKQKVTYTPTANPQ
jgi:hypothetical protein